MGEPRYGAKCHIWAAVIYRDGEPVTGVIPCDDWTAGGLFAEWLAGWRGGPISLGNAVVAARPKPQLDLFGEVA